VPAAHTPWLPVLQAAPPPGLPSSTTPLQLLSLPSQISAIGSASWMQTMAPLVHAVLPAAHTPWMPVLQATLPPGLLSSVLPLQLLSLPSHVSALGCTFWLQTTAPPVHAVVPAAHTPWLPVLQAWAPPGLPLSTTPLQSLSLPSQSS